MGRFSGDPAQVSDLEKAKSFKTPPHHASPLLYFCTTRIASLSSLLKDVEPSTSDLRGILCVVQRPTGHAQPAAPRLSAAMEAPGPGVSPKCMQHSECLKPKHRWAKRQPRRAASASSDQWNLT